MSKDTYLIQTSQDAKKWETQAVFSEGDKGIIHDDLDANKALEEAKNFKETRGDDYPFVKLEIRV